jgi:hypothetical protein
MKKPRTLAAYHKKRRFTKTPEPKGVARETANGKHRSRRKIPNADS